MPRGEHFKNKEKAKANGFSSHPENINRNGRPRALKNVIKDVFMEEFNLQLSSSQANDMIMAMLCMTEKQVSDLGNRDDVPFWLKMISKKMERDMSRGSIHLIEVLFDRVYGKPKETVDTTVSMPQAEIQIGIVQPTIPLSNTEDAIVLD
jgi:hypothetical protein